MLYWDILGISSTTDIAVIKKAYAKKLKLHHPEDDPEGFQQVRQAYEIALEYAKGADKKCGMNLTKSEVIKQKNIETKFFRAPEVKMPIGRDSHDSDAELVEQFMNQVEVIYTSKKLRKNTEKWKAVLENEVYWNLDLKKNLSYRILSLLQENYQKHEYGLPANILRLLNEHFFWLEQQKELYMSFPAEFVDYIIDEMFREPVTLWCIIINNIKKHWHPCNTFWPTFTLAIISSFFTTDHEIALGVIYGIIILLHILWSMLKSVA